MAGAGKKVTLLGRWKAFDGFVSKYAHQSVSTKTKMQFNLYTPPLTEKKEPAPLLVWLSGLTCNEDNFIHKAGALQFASSLGIAILCPDTSPRGLQLPGEHDSWDFGSGAGFYVNATEKPWSDHYRMYDYVNVELPALMESDFADEIAPTRAIAGHSMGGHGALVSYLRNPDMYTSCSVFSPIVHPTIVPWGQKAFTGYLGPDQTKWKQYDAVELVAQFKGNRKVPIMIDFGTADEFLDKQLKPTLFKDACQKVNQALIGEGHGGYDHSYYFISSFIQQHIVFHSLYLK